ncbi:MAG TPA: DinB family protein [Candidatus Kapabacteria bacterium]|nr:DinB family protein [Candidatus Kapabacteria bacterium]
MGLYRSLYDSLKDQHLTLRQIVSRVDEKRLMLHPAPGKWSIHDNITHLAKYQPVFLDRIRIILETNEPRIERYSAETDPEFETWRKWDTNRLLDVLDEDRTLIFSFVQSLSESEFNRIGVHSRYGKLNLTQWTEFFLLHEAHHIYTIFQLANDTTLK